MSFGKLKTIPEDFQVFEVLPLPPQTAPEPSCHYYRLRKCNYTTFEAVQLIAERCGIARDAIGYAGLKDEDGITEQHVSVPLAVAAPELEAMQHASRERANAFVELVHLRGGSQPLSAGKLAGNDFRLVVRDLDPQTAAALQTRRCWTSLFVNYYGPQRFGLPNEPKTTPRIGELLLQEQWADALALIATLGDANGARARMHEGDPGAFFEALDPRVRAFYESSFYSRDWNARLAEQLRAVCGERIRSEVHDSIEYEVPVERAQTLELLRRCPRLEYVAVRAERGAMVATRKNRATVVAVRVERHRVFEDALHEGRWACEIGFFLPSGSYATIATPHFVADVQTRAPIESDVDVSELSELYGIPSEVPNWRPAGTWRPQCGEAILFRSGAPARMTTETAQRVRGWLGISCYVDLRTDVEIRKSGEMPGLQAALEWRHFPIASAEELRGTDKPTYRDYGRDYIRTLDENGGRFAEILTFLADSPHRGYAIGCRAGKDRTGLAVMLLLAAAGASRAAILSDYESSTEHLRRDAAHFSDHWEARRIHRDEYVACHLFADRRAMELACRHLDEHYGGAAAYLLRNGMKAETVSRLRNKFAACAEELIAHAAAGEVRAES